MLLGMAQGSSSGQMPSIKIGVALSVILCLVGQTSSIALFETQATQLAQEAFNFHNKVREDPKCLIPFLREDLKNFDGSSISRTEYSARIMTSEGPKAWEEAIEFLQKQEPVHRLKWSQSLEKSATDHALYLGKNGLMSHIGEQATTMQDRIGKYNKDLSMRCGESLQSIIPTPDTALTARNIIQGLVVDDGVSTRGHRANIFNTDFKSVAIGIADHKTYQGICVLDYSFKVK
jgi:uncharacterized protein YkwD